MAVVDLTVNQARQAFADVPADDVSNMIDDALAHQSIECASALSKITAAFLVAKVQSFSSHGLRDSLF